MNPCCQLEPFTNYLNNPRLLLYFVFFNFSSILIVKERCGQPLFQLAAGILAVGTLAVGFAKLSAGHVTI